MTPLTLQQVQRIAALERRWLADSTERLRRPVRRLLPTPTQTAAQEDQR